MMLIRLWIWFGLAVCFSLISGLFTVTHAHDLWLIPPQLIKPNTPLVIRAHSGMEFPLSEHAPNPARFTRRFVIGPDGRELPLLAKGTENKSGLLEFTPVKPGIYLAAVTTEPKLITLAAEEFNHYLVSDGLPHIYRLRYQEGILSQPGKERYSKSPKTIIQMGEGNTGDPTRELGLPLEIIPLCNPFQLKVGNTLPVKVLFRQQPLFDAHLGWDIPGDGEEVTGTVRTNAKGEAIIPLSQSGLMTIRITHMTRPKQAEYEWESFWTTLTFRLLN